jgi:hypothetical protein
MENEYARIVAEQGIPGLFLWLVFIVWMLRSAIVHRSQTFFLARRLTLVTCAIFFATGLIGTGLFTSIPQAAIMLLYVGWLLVPPLARVHPGLEQVRKTPGFLAPVAAHHG